MDSSLHLIPWFRVSLLVAAVVGVISLLQLLPVVIGRRDIKEGPWLIGLFVVSSVQAVLIFYGLGFNSENDWAVMLWWRHANLFFALILYVGFMRAFLRPWGTKLYAWLGAVLLGLLCFHFILPHGLFAWDGVTAHLFITKWGEPTVVLLWEKSPFYWVFAILTVLVLSVGLFRAVQLRINGEYRRTRILFWLCGVSLAVIVLTALSELYRWGLIFSPFGLLCSQIIMSFDFVREALRAKELDEQLQEKNVQIQEMAAKVPGVLFSILLHGEGEWKPLFISASMQSMFGIDSNDSNGLQKLAQGLGEDERSRFHVILSACLREQTDLLFSSSFQRADGVMIWFQCVASPLQRSEGVVFNGVLVDVSDRVKFARDKEDMVRQIQLRKDELEALLYSLSHDLRTPFFSIDGFSLEAKRFLDEKFPRILHAAIPSEHRQKKILRIVYAEVYDSLARVHSNVERASDLVTQLLVIGRHSRDQLNIERLHPDVLFNQVFIKLRPEMEPIKLNLIGCWPSCSVDATQLALVFSTILTNASQYRSPLRELRMEASARINNNRILIAIQDNGIGFPSQYSEIIFKAFHRLQPSDNVNGRGIGLTIARLAIRRMEGSMWAEGKAGIGATFYVELPL